MFWKIFYLTGFLLCVWFGMTQLGQNADDLQKQSVGYSQRHNRVNVRFSASAVGLPLVIRPQVLGHKVEPSVKKNIRFYLKNIGHHPIQFSQRMSLKPSLGTVIEDRSSDEDLIDFAPVNKALRHRIDPGEDVVLDWNYELKPISHRSVDTVSLALELHPER
ncbi:MAG: hypothetical protein R3B45_11480 [Bdellovibrionota bacterium]